MFLIGYENRVRESLINSHNSENMAIETVDREVVAAVDVDVQLSSNEVNAEFSPDNVQVEYSSSQWRNRISQVTDNGARWLRTYNGLFTTLIFGLCWVIGVFLITCGLYMLSCEISRHQQYINLRDPNEEDVEYEAIYSNWQIYINILGGTVVQLYIGIMFYIIHVRNKKTKVNKSHLLHDDLPPSYDDVVLHDDPPPMFSDLHLDIEDVMSFQDTSNLIDHQVPIATEHTAPVHGRLLTGPLFSLHI